MVYRIWHGWTSPEDADAYENLLKSEIFPGIAAKAVAGYLGIKLLRRAVAGEVAFITIMHFTSLEAVRRFAGEDYETAYVPEKARRLLTRFDRRSQHYDLRESIDYPSD